jgi:hypothetical protein
MNNQSKKREQMQIKITQTRNSVKANSENAIKSTKNLYMERFEKFGYRLANRMHKVGVLTLVGFIFFNIVLFAKEYNAYWKARRVMIII